MVWPFRSKPSVPDATQPRAQSSRVLSFLSPDEARMLGGIPAQAVVGTLAGADGDLSVDAFRRNPLFTAFLHETIKLWGPADFDLVAAAREQRDGWIYIIDLRTPEGPAGRVPPEDIIGAFQVRGGEIVNESYEPMPSHQVYTRNGMCQLPPTLREALVSRLPRVS